MDIQQNQIVRINGTYYVGKEDGIVSFSTLDEAREHIDLVEEAAREQGKPAYFPRWEIQ
jgi:hypothetical protein